MSEIIKLEDRRRKRENNKTSAVIVKSVDGHLIECINVDALTPTEKQRFLAQK